VQNIGAYGVELQDRFDSLDAIDLDTGRSCYPGRRAVRLRLPRLRVQALAAAGANDFGLSNRALITRVRFCLAQAVEGGGRLCSTSKSKMLKTGNVATPNANDSCSTGSAPFAAPNCLTRRVLGNAGSFFKNPTVSPEQCADIIAARIRRSCTTTMDDGSGQARGRLADRCVRLEGQVGRQCRRLRPAGVGACQPGRPRQNRSPGGEVMTLAKAIQTSVYERFGILLEPEPVVVYGPVTSLSHLNYPAHALPHLIWVRVAVLVAAFKSRYSSRFPPWRLGWCSLPLHRVGAWALNAAIKAWVSWKRACAGSSSARPACRRS
jgi:UDP-N-acetylmuramate dehydrogenase